MIQNLPKPTPGLTPENFTPTFQTGLRVIAPNGVGSNINPVSCATLQCAADLASLMLIAAPSVPFDLVLVPAVLGIGGPYQCIGGSNDGQVPAIEFPANVNSFGKPTAVLAGIYADLFNHGYPAQQMMTLLAQNMIQTGLPEE
jgi:hypothetical protein